MHDTCEIPHRILGLQRLAERPHDEAEGLLREASRLGFRWVDAADVYGRLVSRVTPRLRVATKGGLRRERGRWIPDGRASHLEAAAEESRRRLGVDTIDLYQLHVPDPRVPIATSARALARLVQRGVVRAVGLCNVTVGQLREAREHVPIASVQVPLGPLQSASVRSGIVEVCLAQSIPVLAYRPLGGVDGVAKLRRDPVLRVQAARLSVTPEALALAWLADLGVIPVPGPTRSETLHSCAEALELALDDEARAALDEVFEAGRQLRRRDPPALRLSA